MQRYCTSTVVHTFTHRSRVKIISQQVHAVQSPLHSLKRSPYYPPQSSQISGIATLRSGRVTLSCNSLKTHGWVRHRTNDYTRRRTVEVLFAKYNHTLECDVPDRACARIIKCWVCGHMRDQHPLRFLDEIRCEKCKTLQPPHPDYNYFDLFDRAPTFDLNVKELQTQFRRSQSLLHPDKWSMSTAEEQRNAAMQSAHLNNAFRVLREPLSRGLYLLKLRGMDIKERSQSNEPAFLMEIMEINEAIEDATSAEEVTAIYEENKERIKTTIEKATVAFRAEDLQTAQKCMGMLQFYENIDQLTSHWTPDNKRPSITH
eukprot:CFRG1390T1